MTAPRAPGGPTVCLVDCHLTAAFQALGCRVIDLWSPAPLFDVAAALEEAGERPDLLLQQERLHGRVLLLGLDRLDCPKLFWAIDVHQNGFWQTIYATLFDGLLCSQKSWLPAFRQPVGETPAVAALAWLPWFGRPQPWRPHALRSRPLAFVGRLSDSRPTRRNMVERLRERFGLEARDNLNSHEVDVLHADARLIPNEALMGEINFRLFETAQAGALSFTPACEELAELFEPGAEVETYDHALDLEAKLRFYLDRPEAAERLALAGWRRVQRDHLPERRAESVLALARTLTASALKGDAARLNLWLTAQGLIRAGRLALPPQDLEALALRVETELLSLTGHPDADAALVAQWSESRHPHANRRAMTFLGESLTEGRHPAALAFNLACSMAALRQNAFDPARRFWLRWRTSQPGAPRTLPETPKGLYLQWANDLRRQGLLFRMGLPFNSDRHLPARAVEALLMAHALDQADLAPLRALDALLAGWRGFEPTRLALLSRLSLSAPEDWRLGLRLGLANLRAFRVEAGTEELLLAWDRARSAFEGDRFERALAAQDPDGAIRAALGLPSPLAATAPHA